MKKDYLKHQAQRFSIRKYSFGAASVLIGCVLFLTAQSVSADEISANSIPAAEKTVSQVAPLETAAVQDKTSTVTAQPQVEQLQSAEAAVKSQTKSASEGSDNQDKNSPINQAAENPSVAVSDLVNETKNSTVKSEQQATVQPTQKIVPVTDKTDGSAVKLPVFAASKHSVKSVQPRVSAQTVQKKATTSTISLAPQGNYTFKKRTFVKNEPKISSADQFFFDAGQKVYYDKVLETDGHQWISYVSYSGTRRYVPIGVAVLAPAVPKATDTKQSLPASGTYHFTKQADVKNEAKMSSPTQFSFYKGDQVYYDKVLEADNHQWISYISYSGIRRYVVLASLAAPAKPQPKPTDTKVSGTISIQNKTNQQFDVRISKVSSTQPIQDVKVPVWSEQNGQDDIIWYKATKVTDGSYKVTVNIKDHKNNTGKYNVHLYYQLSNGQLAGVGTAVVTVEASQPSAKKNLPASGTYTFTTKTDVKNEAKMSSPTQFSFNKGDQVFYDKVLETDGHQWISYVSYSGTRRYVPIAALTQRNGNSTNKPDPAAPILKALPSQGTYTFTKEVSVKNEAKLASPTQFTFKAGEKINYDRVLTADGRQWISYVSYSGVRRYVIIN